MYRYDEFDHKIVKERTDQFRHQVARRLKGELSEDQFKPLRLMNGVYLQLHAYMLRIAVPYGTLSSRQLRQLAMIARKYDRGYGHFTTRQNIQLNWPKLKDIPAILDALAQVEMHCIQTSGNCIRNVTADHYAGVAKDEIEDPRIWSEIIRQWSTFHPEFSFLPRKFKIAVTGCTTDRAAILAHDIGIRVVKNDQGETGFAVYAGGGQGRTPMIAQEMSGFVSKADLIPYLEAILRVYNRHGRRDNLFKARIKILVHTLGAEEMRKQVGEAFAAISDRTYLRLPEEEEKRIRAYFAPPPYEQIDKAETPQLDDPEFDRFVRINTAAHKIPHYTIVNISLKTKDIAPGDASSEQMEAIADIAEKFSFGEVRVTHEQNLTLAHVRKKDLAALWQELKKHDLATPNIGLISDQITCPGLDYCNLANARSIPIAQDIAARFADPARQEDIGAMKIKISGCMNACGHHHVGHIGILGVDKKGTEYYQVTLGGSADENTAIGKLIGPAFTEEEIVDAIENIVETYRGLRRDDQETFLETWRRVGNAPFKERLYPSSSPPSSDAAS